jgi:nucleoside-diphosphate-sugar epimerase
MTQLLAGERKIKLGALHPTRDLNYVTDTCAGFIALAGCDAALGRAVNIGSGREISVGDLAGHIIACSGKRASLVTDGLRKRPAGSEVERLLADNTLIKELTGWTPKVSLEKGLEKTMAWFRDPANLRRYKTDIYNV